MTFTIDDLKEPIVTNGMHSGGGLVIAEILVSGYLGDGVEGIVLPRRQKRIAGELKFHKVRTQWYAADKYISRGKQVNVGDILAVGYRPISSESLMPQIAGSGFCLVTPLADGRAGENFLCHRFNDDEEEQNYYLNNFSRAEVFRL